MKFIRILAQSVNDIIHRLDNLKLVPNETLVLITENTFNEFIKMGSNVQLEKEDPVTRQPHPIPITKFNLFSIYAMKTVPIILGNKTVWTAIISVQAGHSTRSFSSVKAGYLVLIELNDSVTDVITLEIGGM